MLVNFDSSPFRKTRLHVERFGSFKHGGQLVLTPLKTIVFDHNRPCWGIRVKFTKYTVWPRNGLKIVTI